MMIDGEETSIPGLLMKTAFWIFLGLGALYGGIHLIKWMWTH